MRHRRKTLDLLYAEIRQWQRQTFPYATAASCAKHLESEVKELLRSPSDVREIADCVLWLFAVADRAGIDLAAVVQVQFEVDKAGLAGLTQAAVNKTRGWGGGGGA